MNYMFYESPVGKLTIHLDKDVIRAIVFGHQVSDGKFNDDPVLGMNIFDELDSYFAGKSKKINLKFKPDGSEFQRMIWNVLLEIPYGETTSYSKIAERAGKPKAARAVGTACKSNPIPILIPCHRVIGKNGSLTGYAGGLDNKIILLEIENKNK